MEPSPIDVGMMDCNVSESLDKTKEESMKVVFLDIDGVLNSEEWWKRNPISGAKPFFDRQWRPCADACIDPDAVSRLNKICERTGAVVVVSSSWRLEWPVDKLQSMLERRGFIGTVVGATLLSGTNRGGEIDRWLRAVNCVESFVILDDDSDMKPHMGRLYQTSFGVGLVDSAVDPVCRMLGYSA